MKTDDGCIIRECLSGESEAFGVLVDKYKSGIYAYTYTKLGNLQDAQDATQETFLKAYRGLHGLRHWEIFAFWLYRIASNVCKEWLKDRFRHPDREHIEDLKPGVLGASSIDIYHDTQLDESIREELASLPETYREVLMLYYFAGMNSKEMAKVLGTSPAAIRTRLSRARAQMRNDMIAAMGAGSERQRLPASFTFRVVEAVKRIRIRPIPRLAGLPWGLSAAVGILAAFYNLGPYVNIPHPASPPRYDQSSSHSPADKGEDVELIYLSEFSYPVASGTAGRNITDKGNGSANAGYIPGMSRKAPTLTQTVDAEGNTGLYSSLVFDNQNNPAISYYDDANGDLKYSYWDSANWKTEVVVSQGNVGKPTSLVLDASGNPAIAYYDYDNCQLRCARRKEAAWDIQVIDSVGAYSGEGYYCYRISLANGPSGNLAIAYYSGGDGDSSSSYYDLKYAHFNGSDWEIQTVYDDGYSGETGRIASLAFDADSNPGIVFRQQSIGLYYAHWNGASWDIEIVDTGYGTGAFSSFAYDHLGNPAIAYFWQDPFNVPGQLRYAYFNGSKWDIHILDDAPLYQIYPSLAFDPSGNPAISYYYWPDKSLKYIWWNGASWESRIVDSGDKVGLFNSLKFDNEGNPAISYYDEANGDLKFASTDTSAAATKPSTTLYSGY